MSNRPATLKYLFWFGLLILCIFLFFAEANRNPLFSMPIEVFPIPLAASLVAAAYLLKLRNKIFRLFLWIGLLASTVSVAWFILLQMVYPYGTEATIILYSIAALIIAWVQLKPFRAAPN
ncbi:hypothetical protein ACK25U_15065 [Ectopseudomonas mendocina]